MANDTVSPGMNDVIPPGNGLMTPATSTPAPATNGSGNYPITPVATATTATPAATPAPTAAQQAATAAQSFTPTPAMPAPGPVAASATVENRLNDLTSSDSKYMQAARDYALQNMNKRGLMQSSIAVGASQDAAIRAALPIAQQDAQQQFTTDTNYDLHRYDVGRIGAQTAASSLLSTQDAAQARDVNGRPSQKDYLATTQASNDRYAQEFGRIQESTMTGPQKDAAVVALKQWKLADDNWRNTSFAMIEGIQINLQPFFAPDAAATPSSPADPSAPAPAGGGSPTGLNTQFDILKAHEAVFNGQAEDDIRNAGNKIADVFGW